MLFNNDAHQISSDSAEKWVRKWYRNITLKKMNIIMETKNPFEVLLYLYCQKMCFKFLSDSGYILGLKE